MTPLRAIAVTSAGMGDLLPQLANSPVLSQIKGLELLECYGTKGIFNVFKALASCSPKFELIQLTLGKGGAFTRTGFQKLLRLPSIRSVRNLCFLRYDIRNVFEGLLKHRLQLKHLDFNGIGVLPSEFESLVSSKKVEGIRALRLWHAGIDNSIEEAILHSPYLKDLQHLELFLNPPDDRTPSVWRQSLPWDSLVSLGLIGYAPSSEELSALLNSPSCRSLRRFSFAVRNNTIQTIAAWPGLAKLTHLNFWSHDPFSPSSLKPIFESEYWTGRTLISCTWDYTATIRWLRENNLHKWESSIGKFDCPVGNLHDPFYER